MPKYEFAGGSYSFYGHTLRRIRALRDFGDVKAGDLGGWIEHEGNLSHSGDCWVANDAKVMGWAQVRDNAIVCDNAIICDRAQIYGNATVEECAEVRDNAAVFVHATVSGDARIGGYTEIGHHVYIDGCVRIKGGTIGGYAKIGDCASIDGFPFIGDYAHIYEDATVKDRAKITGHAVLGSDVVANGAMFITDNAYLFARNDLLYLPVAGSSRDKMTFYRCEDDSIGMTCNDFHGTWEEFQVKIADMFRDERDMQEYRLAFELAKAHIRCEPLLEKG